MLLPDMIVTFFCFLSMLMVYTSVAEYNVHLISEFHSYRFNICSTQRHGYTVTHCITPSCLIPSFCLFVSSTPPYVLGIELSVWHMLGSIPELISCALLVTRAG